MCMIQTSDVKYPDGTRRTSERLVNCERGTRSQPCINTTHEPILHERDATSAEIRAAHEARYPIITPSSSERPRPQRQSRSKPKGFLGIIYSLFGIRVRTSPRKSYESEPQRSFVRNKRGRPRPDGERAEDRQPVPPPPRAPTPPVYSPPPPPPPPPPGPPFMPSSPIIVPIEPPRGHRSARQEYPHRGQRPPRREREMGGRRRRRRRESPVVHQSSSEESPSPPAASRRHQRRTRSLSPRSRYEEEKRAIRERERQQYAGRLARIARLEQEARDRADRVAEDERRNRQREDRQRRLEFEERRRIESVERARRRQQREEEERTRRRRDEARRRQEQADMERIQAAERLQRLRQQKARMAEQERLDRLHGANIPRPPRHQPTVHGESLDDRGDRVIREAIMAENLAQFERGRRMPPAAYGRYDGGWLGRRNTVDGGQRRHRGWEGRRW